MTHTPAPLKVGSQVCVVFVFRVPHARLLSQPHFCFSLSPTSMKCFLPPPGTNPLAHFFCAPLPFPSPFPPTRCVPLVWAGNVERPQCCAARNALYVSLPGRWPPGSVHDRIISTSQRRHTSYYLPDHPPGVRRWRTGIWMTGTSVEYQNSNEPVLGATRSLRFWNLDYPSAPASRAMTSAGRVLGQWWPVDDG